MDTTVIYPGTFDPITNGHLDLIERASRLFQNVIVGVSKNDAKLPLFNYEQRVSLIQKATSHLNNIKVIGFDTLLVDFAKANNVRVIIRGLRAISDFEFEFQLASMNRRIHPELETLFLTPGDDVSFISSSLIREIVRYGGDVTQFVPSVVASELN